MKRTPLGRRERELLDVLIQMHSELGIEKEFTGPAISVIAGPCAGSLAGLTMRGYVRQRAGDSAGMVYSVTERGYALFAGVEGLIG